MPVPRRKSCNQCRSAKTRCSLSLPCMRCSRRNIACEYASSTLRRTTRTYPEIRPLRSTSTGPSSSLTSTSPMGILDAGLGMSSATPITFPLSIMSSSLVSGPSVADAFSSEWGLNPGVLEGFQLPTGVTNNDTCPAASVNAFDATLSREAEVSSSPPWARLGLESVRNILVSAEQTETGHKVDSLLGPGSSIAIWASQTYLYSPLSQKHLSRVPTTLLTTKLLLGQICDYPKMMIQGPQLPPFIHPRCTMGFQTEPSCPSAGPHRCLPEPLAICSTLIRSFYERTPQSSSFVWRNIYAEQHRLHQEVRQTHLCYLRVFDRSGSYISLVSRL